MLNLNQHPLGGIGKRINQHFTRIEIGTEMVKNHEKPLKTDPSSLYKQVEN
jgi:hypothetical protein